MPRRIDKKQKEIRPVGVAPTIIGNFILIIVLSLAVAAGIVYYCTTILENGLKRAQGDIKTYSNVVDTYLAEGQIKAVKYADMIASGYYDANTSQSLVAQLTALKTLGDFSDVGVIESGGSVTSTDGTVRNAKNAALFDAALSGSLCVTYIEADGMSGVAFAAPIRTASRTEGVLYMTDLGALSVDASTKALIEGVDQFYILDDTNKVCTYIGTAPSGFDYASVADSGLLFPAYRKVSVWPFVSAFRSGYGRPDSSIRISRDHLSVGVWFENELSVNGWRTLAHSVQTFDELNSSQIFIVAAGAVLIILLPLIFTIRGTAAQVLSNRRITEALLFDPVTGGNNFAHFKLHAERLLKKRKYRSNVFAFGIVDINRFRLFADVHGHAEGEVLLVRIFNTLRKNLKPDELLTRYSTDQFSMLFILSPEEDPVARMDRMLKQLSNIYPNETILCSAGVYIVTDRKQSVDRMNSYALVAKDVSKYGRGGTTLFDNQMREKLLAEQQISGLMEKALQCREFALYLQPKYTVVSKRLSGAEALVRWISPDRGFVSPGDFIPLFEKNGFIVRLDDYMLNAVCALLRRWIDEGKRLYPISVNLSRVNFTDRSIAKRIRATVDSYAVPHKYVELELTESAFFDDRETLVATVKQLRRAGFRVSMDDFGSGYSSLNSLRELPLDVIKIDKDFFGESGDTERGELILRDTIRLAKDLNLEIVAEGVETAEQVAFLEGTKCDLIQGFYFAKPMPVEEFGKLD